MYPGRKVREVRTRASSQRTEVTCRRRRHLVRIDRSNLRATRIPSPSSFALRLYRAPERAESNERTINDKFYLTSSERRLPRYHSKRLDALTLMDIVDLPRSKANADDSAIKCGRKRELYHFTTCHIQQHCFLFSHVKPESRFHCHAA
jgi:hypothetical protein